MYRLNKYTHNIENGNKIILYNVITKAMICVEKDYIASDGQIKAESIEQLDEDVFRFLKDRLLISENNNDDVSEMLSIREKFNNQNEIGRFMIHLGYSCNLKCSYCYQTASNKFDGSVDSEKIFSFINKAMVKEDYITLDICYMGGEPLLYLSEIKELTNKINRTFPNKKKIYSIVTNGTLLSKEVALGLLEIGINNYQITLDGIKEDHDKFRSGSFDKIINNIEELSNVLDEESVYINCNISKYNHKTVHKMIDYLKKKNINFPIIYSLIFDNGTNQPMEIKVINESWKEIHIYAMKKGYEFEPFYREQYLGCALTQKNYHIISPEGELYKCINGVGHEKYYLSDISEYGTKEYYRRLSFFSSMKTTGKSCEECEFYPVCNGGCIYRNHINGFKCDKENFIINEYPIIKEIYNAIHS